MEEETGDIQLILNLATWNDFFLQFEYFFLRCMC